MSEKPLSVTQIDTIIMVFVRRYKEEYGEESYPSTAKIAQAIYDALLSKEEGIRSMEEFQRKYFPNSVGKECPYCGAPAKGKAEKEENDCEKWLRERHPEFCKCGAKIEDHSGGINGVDVCKKCFHDATKHIKFGDAPKEVSGVLNRDYFINALAPFHGGNPHTWLPAMDELYNEKFAKLSAKPELVPLDYNEVCELIKEVCLHNSKNKLVEMGFMYDMVPTRNIAEELCAKFGTPKS